MDEYIASLHWTKQRKALLNRDLYDLITRVLEDPNDTTLGSDLDRHWIRTFFELGEKDGAPVPLRRSRGGLPCALREEIYEALKVAHVETGHAGRDKTFTRVKDSWSYIPKALATRFVKLCPTCTPESLKPSKPLVPPVELPRSPPPASTSSWDEHYSARFFSVPSTASTSFASSSQAPASAASFFSTVPNFPTFPSSLPNPGSTTSSACSPVAATSVAFAGIETELWRQPNSPSFSVPSAFSQASVESPATLHLTAKPPTRGLVESAFPPRSFGTQIQSTSSSTSSSHNSLCAPVCHSGPVMRDDTHPSHYSSQQLDESQVAWALVGFAAVSEGYEERSAGL
ncbi:hypothetical protein JCM10295v2_006555 [Rhodotorula toruloides]